MQLVSNIGLDFFSVINVLILCATNGTTIVITLIAYKKLTWLHALGPLIMLTQLAACLQTQMYAELGDKSVYLIQGSFVIFYCLILFTMVTKWCVQAPLIFMIAQIGLYIINIVWKEEEGKGDWSDIFGVIILNTVLPMLVLCIACSAYKTKMSLYLSKMNETISQIELSNVLKMIP